MNNPSVELETEEVVPDPVALLESMRAIGYTAESAIADLIDNCISAHASVIDVEYDAMHKPFVAILDNGDGMTMDQLRVAMRHGSRNPSSIRDAHDLGRFGLGLKTASMSQCRHLTVVTKRNGLISALKWDLDVICTTGKWLVVVPRPDEISQFPLQSCLTSFESGTLVIWHELDRLTAGSADVGREMSAKFSGLREHLALVFHRFTVREERNPAISIRINGLLLPPRDPFLRENTFRQPLEGQNFRHERGVVTVAPYVLPPISRLTPEEIELAGGGEGLRGSQGFYVYRNRRLVSWGTWFRLAPKHEFFKLTRIQVDIPNTFDDLWSLDIKKSAAQPPDFIRTRLRELIPHFAGASKRTVTYAGRRTRDTTFATAWSRSEPGHGHFRYDVNMDHPAVIAFSASLNEDGRCNLEALLRVLSTGLPMESIYSDMCADTRPCEDNPVVEDLTRLAQKLKALTGFAAEDVMNIDPLIRYPGLRQRILEALRA